MILFEPERSRLSEKLAKQAGAPVRLPSARLLDAFLAEAQKAARLKGEISVMISTDLAIRRLNREYRGKDKATDVLSFPAEGVGAEGLAGDLMISAPTALRQAGTQKHTLTTEMKVLLLHGVLHLAGYDHETDQGQMARLEQKLRAKLGLPQGLIERVTEKPVAAPKTAARKKTAVANKAAAKKSLAKKPAAKKVVAKTPAVKKVAAKKTASKKSVAAPAARSAAPKSAAVKSGAKVVAARLEPAKPMRRACGTGKAAAQAKRGSKR